MYKNGFVYIMSNINREVFYIGVTSNLEHRIYDHKYHLIKNSFTDRYNLEYLVYYEMYDRIVDAIDREKQIKKWNRDKKITLILSKNKNMKDLYDDIIDGNYDLI